MLVYNEDKTIDRISEIIQTFELNNIKVMDEDKNYRNINDILDDLNEAWVALDIDDPRRDKLSIVIASSIPVYTAVSANQIGESMKRILREIENQ